jgi:release factor glutamine methyltransferase
MTTTYQDYLKGTLEILENSQKEKENYKIKILNRDFVVFPNVFSPKYFKDTLFFIENLQINQGEDFLEIGPGTGAISVFAAIKGASKVTAIDLNLDAVNNTKENIRINNVEDKVNVLQGNVYSPLSKDEKFDTIFWNTPFGYIDEGDIDILQKSVQDPNYESTRKFVFEAKNHLKNHGKLVIGFSKTLGKFEIIESFLNEAGFKTKEVARINSDEKYPVSFEIYESRLS